MIRNTSAMNNHQVLYSAGLYNLRIVSVECGEKDLLSVISSKRERGETGVYELDFSLFTFVTKREK